MKKGTAIKKPIPVDFILLEDNSQSVFLAYEFINGKPPYTEPASSITHDKWWDYCNDLSKQ